MKRRTDELVMPLSSLIDIVFLLIIFFVVTASVQQQIVDQRVKLAKTRHVEPEQPAAWTFTVNIRLATAGGLPVYNVNGDDCDLAAAQSRLDRERAVRGQDMPVIIRAGAGVKYRHVDAVARCAMNAGLSKVMHATESLYE